MGQPTTGGHAYLRNRSLKASNDRRLGFRLCTDAGLDGRRQGYRAPRAGRGARLRELMARCRAVTLSRTNSLSQQPHRIFVDWSGLLLEGQQFSGDVRPLADQR